MTVKIILIVSLLKVCAGEGSSNDQRQSNHAISSQSFVRHDVPLAYQYNAVHIYTTQKPELYNHKPIIPQTHLIKSQLPKEIQYAPIFRGQTDQNALYSGYLSQKGEDVKPKPNLEPRPQELPNTKGNEQDQLSYVPGYNVELYQSLNRYPGHNAVYRSYPNMHPTDKINKVNLLNTYVLYQKPEDNFLLTSTTNQPNQTKATLSPFVPKQHQPTAQAVQKPQVYNAAHIATVKTAVPSQGYMNIQDLIPHPKAHRMLLNLARTYNIAGYPQKAQYATLTKLKNVPHTHAIIHIPNPAELERNTRLLPIQNKPMHHLAHLSS